ncbi:MAG: translation initiation factor IF-2 N-terminal domain-containing protein [Bacillota bacterium]|nr:translation initiation factor IF-2 N-terminal domain-containing protein [Bacillota bacterium]
MISTLLVSIVAILIAISIYSMTRYKSFMNSYLKSFNETISEAAVVKDDLEELMGQTVQISENIVNEICVQVDEKHDQHNRNETSLPRCARTKKTVHINENDKMRIYELARSMDIPTKELLFLVRDLGIPASNHMNNLDQNQIKQIKQRIFSGEQSTAHTKDVSTYSCVESSRSFQGEIDDNQTENMSAKQSIRLDEIKASHPYMAVRVLYEEGYSIREIAQILERGQGEINLILNLADKKKLAK